MEQPDMVRLKKSDGKLLIQAPSHGSYLAYIRTLIGDLARQVGFPEDEVAKIEMAVDEACSNVIEHAYAPHKQWLWKHPEPQIHLHISTTENRLIIEINDHGQRFDFASYNPVDITRRVDEMKTDGYGVAIMRQFMDEVSYSSNDQTGNTLRLVKHLKKST